MRFGYAFAWGLVCWLVASWVGVAVEGPRHQMTLWNWLVLVGAFLVGWIASLAFTSTPR